MTLPAAKAGLSNELAERPTRRIDSDEEFPAQRHINREQVGEEGFRPWNIDQPSRGGRRELSGVHGLKFSGEYFN